jgi:hypothetical protein
MKKAFSVLLVLVLAFVFAQAAMAEKKAAPKKDTSKPGVVVADAVVLTATVEAVDYEKRTVTLKGTDGQTKTITIDKSAKNFDQVKVGDKVTAEFFESVAVFVRKSSTPADAGEATAVQVAPKGEKPRVVAVNTVEITATVEAIDYKKRTITLKGPQGNVRTLPVDKRVKRFKEIKKGDEVVIRHTEAVAIKVEKP